MTECLKARPARSLHHVPSTVRLACRPVAGRSIGGLNTDSSCFGMTLAHQAIDAPRAGRT